MKNFLYYLFTTKRQRAEDRLTEKAIAFLNYLKQGNIAEATDFLENHRHIVPVLKRIQQAEADKEPAPGLLRMKALSTYLRKNPIYPVSYTANLLSLPEKQPAAEKLFRSLCEAGLDIQAHHIALICRHKFNFPLICDLYEKKPLLRPLIDEQQLLHPLAQVLAKPTFNQQAVKLFIEMHRAGIKADKKCVELLLTQAHNTSLLNYLFIAQYELSPIHDKEFAQKCIEIAFKNNNLEGATLLYKQGIQLNQTQLQALHISAHAHDVAIHNRSFHYRQRSGS